MPYNNKKRKGDFDMTETQEIRVKVKKSFPLLNAMNDEETGITIPVGTKGFALKHICEVPIENKNISKAKRKKVLKKGKSVIGNSFTTYKKINFYNVELNGFMFDMEEKSFSEFIEIIN